MKTKVRLEEFEWRFRSEDGEYSFIVKGYTAIGAYNNAYDKYGPQVENMIYQRVIDETDS